MEAVEGCRVLVKGAGDLATGIIRRLHLVGMYVAATEVSDPLCVRREVSFAAAVERGQVTVEGVTARLCDIDDVEKTWQDGQVALVVDPEATVARTIHFDAVVDARMAKRSLGTRMDEAGAVVGIGPGFTAGKDCHAVVETYMGHDIGRVIWEGTALPDTRRAGPGEYSSFMDQGPGEDAWDRIVIRSPGDGIFRANIAIGDLVEEGDIVGTVDDEPVRVDLPGVIRGLIRDGREVRQGLKLGDVDPSGEIRRAFQVSDKANAVGGGVVEAVCVLLRRVPR